MAVCQHVVVWQTHNDLTLNGLFTSRVLRTDSIPEVGEDAAATVGMAETLSEEEQEELRRELAKVNLLNSS